MIEEALSRGLKRSLDVLWRTHQSLGALPVYITEVLQNRFSSPP